MNDIKFIVNVYYEPCQELKTYIDEHKSLYLPVNAGSLSTSTDEWIKNNIIFETSSTDNIAELNRKINELTAIYWFWKNVNWKKYRYVGFQHYRRFFVLDLLDDYYEYDAIVSLPLPMKFSVRTKSTSKIEHLELSIEDGYKLCHNISDFVELEKLIPQQFKLEWNTWKSLKYMFAPCNMFLIKTEYFHNYCSELFSYIFSLNSTLNLDGRDNYQNRAMAFLSERLTSFWFWRNRYNLKTKMIKTAFNKTWKIDQQADLRGTYDT